MPLPAGHPPKISDRFSVEALAGVGGMATVYRARDGETGRTVALKVLNVTAKPKDVERFAREVRFVSELRHPGIVEYLSHGVTEAGQPYLVMEWLSGEDLSQRLSRGTLSLSESLALLRRTAEALAVAHDRGVVHRDLKPGNLFLRDNQVERVVILDFGIARTGALAQAITNTGAVIGSPSYMAPEQARGELALTPAVDVFALGCVLFECLTGEPPFSDKQVCGVLAKIIFTEPPKLRGLRPDLPASIEGLLSRMLQKKPSARLQDASALLAALGTLDMTVTGAPPARTTARPARDTAEQSLVSLLMATPGRSSAGGPPGAAGSSTGAPDIEALMPDLVAHGARVERLADGSLVATLMDARGTATDQAAQAARCALLIKARWPAAAIALCTGRGLMSERLPIGEVLDRATALLRDHAGPQAGSPAPILLDDVTRGLLDARFRVARTASGAHALTAEERTLDASRPLLGKPTPCVGRETELGMLTLVLEGCIEDPAARGVLITAPPGVGKSRLRHELLRRIEARGEPITILIGRGDPMSAGSAYGLLGQALRRCSGIVDGEDLEVRRAKLARRLGQRLPASAKDRVVAFLGELCGVPFPDEAHRKLRAARLDPLVMSDQISLAMLDFLRAECEVGPVLLVLEDLHWGDALTVKLVETALREVRQCPLMILALARPEVKELLPPGWNDLVQPLLLRPLSRKAGERLAREVLGAHVPGEAVAKIVDQSAGHALFLEELIRAEAEGRGAEAPETVLAILQARIGRFEPDTRWVLRVASVFGETAWVGGIRALLGDALGESEIDERLRALFAEEILEERPDSRFPSEREVRFRHALTRDAAYGLFTDSDRVAGHRRAAHYLEALWEPDARVLAEHFEKGHERARAVPYYLQAAEQSYETNDMGAVLACAERGLGCGARGEQRGALLGLTAAACWWRERQADVLAVGGEALDLLPEGSRRWCRAIQYRLLAAITTQRFDLLAELSSRLMAAEPSADAQGVYVRAVSWLALNATSTGPVASVPRFLERAGQIAEAGPADEVSLAHLKAARATYRRCVEQDPWRCTLEIQECLRAIEDAGDRRYQCLLGTYHGVMLQGLGDLAGAEASLRQILAQAEQLGEALLRLYATAFLARLLAASPSPDRQDEAERLARIVIDSGNLFLLGTAYAVLAEIDLLRGDLASADAHARAAHDAARPLPPWLWSIAALRMRILRDLGRPEEALALGEEVAREMTRLGFVGDGTILLGLALAEAHHATGHIEAARDTLADALRQLRLAAERIPDGAARDRFLTAVPENARLLELEREWLGGEGAREAV